MRTLVDHVVRDAGSYQVAWDGRDPGGHLVADGPYRFRATATTDSGCLGHDGLGDQGPPRAVCREAGRDRGRHQSGSRRQRSGCDGAGTMEKDMNLAISLRLRRMLEGSGIGVVMTRSTDVDVNRPATDRNGDGMITHQDELVARNDVADIARADLVVNIHNNATACRCGQGTEVFVNRKRPWSAESLALGKAIQSAFIRRLMPFESASWKVHDNGIGNGGRYYSLRPANAAGPRPALMPAILGETLYLDRAAERAKLRDPRVQTALAAGYFDGITRFLATRRFGIRYTGIQAPDRVPAGGDATVRLRVRNTGNVQSSGWRIEARLVRRVPVLDGSGKLGHARGQGRAAGRDRAGRGRGCGDPHHDARIRPSLAAEDRHRARGGAAQRPGRGAAAGAHQDHHGALTRRHRRPGPTTRHRSQHRGVRLDRDREACRWYCLVCPHDGTVGRYRSHQTARHHARRTLTGACSTRADTCCPIHAQEAARALQLPSHRRHDAPLARPDPDLRGAADVCRAGSGRACHDHSRAA